MACVSASSAQIGCPSRRLRSVKAHLNDASATSEDLERRQALKEEYDRAGFVILRGFLTAFCLCEKDGKPTYDSGSKSEANEAFLKHVQSVCELPLALVEPLFEAACDINGFNEGSAKN